MIEVTTQAYDHDVSTPSGRRGRAGIVILAIGALILLGAAAIGVVLWRGPSVTPVPYGGRAVVAQNGIFGVTVFTSGGPANPPQCFLNGDSNPLGQPPSSASTASGLEATYSFGVTFPAVEGTTYTVTCGKSGQPGEFAAIQYEPQIMHTAFVGVGIPGLLVCAVGGLVLVLGRRHRQT